MRDSSGSISIPRIARHGLSDRHGWPSCSTSSSFLPHLCSLSLSRPRNGNRNLPWKKSRIRFSYPRSYFIPACNFSTGIPSTLNEDTFGYLPLVCSLPSQQTGGRGMRCTELLHRSSADGLSRDGGLFRGRSAP